MLRLLLSGLLLPPRVTTPLAFALRPVGLGEEAADDVKGASLAVAKGGATAADDNDEEEDDNNDVDETDGGAGEDTTPSASERLEETMAGSAKLTCARLEAGTESEAPGSAPAVTIWRSQMLALAIACCPIRSDPVAVSISVMTPSITSPDVIVTRTLRPRYEDEDILG